MEMFKYHQQKEEKKEFFIDEIKMGHRTLLR
jgi:hypothetical protein